MPWNSPGDNNQDPWNSKKKNNEQGPPDLDEVFQNLSRKFGGVFSGGGGQGKAPGGASGGNVFALVAGIAALFWIASGIYTVQEGTEGVVLQFGEFKETTQPGLHWHFPYPIEEVRKVNMAEVRDATHQTAMLTQDENIVEIVFTAQYIVNDATKYLFSVRSPDVTLKQAMESAIREVVGKSQVDFVLYEGLELISSRTRELMQEILNSYETGFTVTSLNLQKTQPPTPVQAAFDDVNKSREDRERYINEAESYANTIVPKARGEAARILEEANAYKESVIAKAEGETDRFLALLSEYEKAPSVTRERLYIEAVESVFSNSSKVMLDVEGGNNLLYLPLDKIIQNQDSGRSNNTQGMTPTPPNSSTLNDLRRRTVRGRESR